MTAALVAEQVCKRYGDVQAVDGVSFEVPAGEIFGLLGPNGAGKTTALEITEGLRQADSGQVRLFGQPVWPRNPDLLGRIGVQLQTSAFFDRLTAREQLRVFASLYGAPPARVPDALARVGLTDSAKVRVEKMSGGQVQRLAIACALVHDPDVVFLDEPSAGLDPQSRQHLWDVIRAIAQAGKTVIMTTHYMDEAETLCDRVAIMDHGRVLALDAPARLVRDLDVAVQVLLPASALDPAQAAELPGAETVRSDGVTTTITTRNRAKLLRELDHRALVDHVEVHGATLQDVFLALTGREWRQ
ncbi:MAG: ABC transporter ATP-binding protein [Acidimicrobiales bacterium]